MIIVILFRQDDLNLKHVYNDFGVNADWKFFIVRKSTIEKRMQTRSMSHRLNCQAVREEIARESLNMTPPPTPAPRAVAQTATQAMETPPSRFAVFARRLLWVTRAVHLPIS